jgi:carboxyl-terminal processing protease
MARRDLDTQAKEQRPLPDAATLYVYRPGSLFGTAVSILVSVDDAPVAVLAPSTFVAVTLRPGEHKVLVRRTWGDQGRVEQTLVVEAGRNYYVHARPALGLFGPNITAEVVANEAAAASEVRRCGLVASAAAERVRLVAGELAKRFVDPVDPEALVTAATRAIAGAAGADPAPVKDLEEAVGRARALRPSLTDADLTVTGVRAMLAVLGRTPSHAVPDQSRAIDSTCGLVLRSNRASVVIADVLPDSPAAVARVEPGLELREIDGRPVRERTPAELVQLLAGPPGTEVALALGRADEPDRKLVLRRAPADPGALDCRILDQRALYLRPWFISMAAARRVRDHARAAGAAGRLVILDLRDAAGFSVDGARELADSFVANGALLAVTGARVAGVDKGYNATPGTSSLEEAAVVVLVNGHTRGTAEAVAAALQDNRRATVLGTRTAGMGVVDYDHDIAGMQLRIPTARLLRPSREPLDGVGVTPDVAEPPAGLPLAARPTDVACPNVASAGAVSDDPLVGRAAALLLTSTAAH